MAEEQLSWDFDSVEEVTINGYDCCNYYITDDVLKKYLFYNNVKVADEVCKHKVIFRACKKGYVTYCNKCGKILSVRNRREK